METFLLKLWFLLILLYFGNCHFLGIENQSKFSIENQYIFASIILLLKINTNFSIEIAVPFELLSEDKEALFCMENQYKYFHRKSVCF